jgi:dynein regulatory complex protein 1
MSHKGGNSALPETEINTNVPDKEERKRLRRKRIEKRNVVATNNEEITEIEQGTSRTGFQQVSDSLFALDKRKHTGLKDVTSVRINTDDLEAKRRIDDEELRRERLGKLQQEALTSAKANAAIEMKWAELLEREIPQELHRDIQIQMTSCSDVIHSKDQLIGDFHKQLRGKDEEYVRTLRQQSDDVQDLLSRVRREFSELQNEYDKELDSIEEAYLEERDRTIADHTADVESMFEHRRNKEIFYKEAKQKREEQYQRDVEELITKGADQYNKLKIELEMNIQTLKQQLEEIRATYQLNTEKLDYNYRVLTELDVEKNAELARYKRRLTKLKDQLNQLVSRYTELEAADSKTNTDLTSDYRSLTRKYKDLQAKFRHFEVADTNKYDEMWTMHEDEAKDMVDQLLKADKIITNQQLGWEWKAPDMHALQSVLGRYGSLGLASAHQGQVGDEEGGGPEIPPEQDATMRRVAGARIRGVLKMLTTEAGFLVNPQVMAALEEMPNDDDADLSRAETMLKALGVKSEERLTTLVSYFFKDAAGRLIAAAPPEEESVEEAELLLHNAPDDVAELKDMIKPEDVIAAVKAYIEDASVEGPVGTSGQSGTAGSAKAKEEDRIALKRLQSMQNYWIQLSQVVNDSSIDVWKQLERNSNTLRELLVKRTSTISEVDSLSLRNAELKKLLNQYLGDGSVNSALVVPPAQVMRVRNVGGSNTGKSGARIKGAKKLMSQTQ